MKKLVLKSFAFLVATTFLALPVFAQREAQTLDLRPVPSTSLAETPTQPATTQTSSLIVTASASAGRVRYASLGEVNHTRLQVFSSQGAQVYDSTYRLGNVVDWQLQDQQSAPLADGSYLFLVTVRDFSGNLTQKYGTALLEQGQVYLEQSARAELPPAQGLALESHKLAATLSSIDRIGAAGLNRTTATTSTDATAITTQPTSGTDTTNAAPGGENIGGTGNQNRVAKWIDNAGTLGDSVMFDNGTGVGVGTTDLTDILVAGNDKFKIVDGPMTFSFRDFSGGQGYFAVGSSTNGIKGFVGHTNNDDGFTLGSFSNHKLTLRTNSVNRLTIDTAGNVGIGTAVPTSRLDVAGAINTSTQYNIGGQKVLTAIGQCLSAGLNAGPCTLNNTFFGWGVGQNNTSSENNSFFGTAAGLSITSGRANSFFGSYAGHSNTSGALNSFFGFSAGLRNETGDHNAFFGTSSGTFNVSGDGNSFFGYHAGYSNVSGYENAFFGKEAGYDNTASANTFFGSKAGRNNTVGFGNIFVGYKAGFTNTSSNNNTFVGYIAGDNSTGNRNTFMGSDAGGSNTSGFSNTFVGSNAGDANETGNNNTAIGRDANVSSPGLSFATAIGAGSRATTSNMVVLGRAADIVFVPGTLAKAAGSFKIDHPLDPTNKYLYHSFVESPDMMNVYNGNVTTDARGVATITLPDYFEALNRDFRYQLTAIGKFAQAIVLQEIEGNRFLIKTSKPRVKVLWQVTGIRSDAYAEANRIPEVELKPEAERGTYLHPGAFAAKSTAGRKDRSSRSAEERRRPARN